MLVSIEATPSPSPMKIIDSKERIFCQYGSRALQQQARGRRLRSAPFLRLVLAPLGPNFRLRMAAAASEHQVSSAGSLAWVEHAHVSKPPSLLCLSGSVAFLQPILARPVIASALFALAEMHAFKGT